MAPTFQAVGAQATSTGASTNVSWPTHLTNDIGLVVIETSGNSATLTPPAGWVAVPGTPVTDVATTAGSKLHVWWRRATSAAMGTVATGAATDHIVARLYTFRGCVTTGNPWNVTTTGTKTTASTTATVPALVTTLDDTLITMIVGRPDDSSSTTHFGVPVNAGLTGLGEAAEAGTINGNGGGFVVSYGIETTPGSTGTSTLSKTASTTDTYVVLALKANTELITTVGTFNDNGVNVDLVKSSVIFGTTQTYSLVGNTADFSKSVSLNVNVGAFTLSGTTTGLLFNRTLIKQVGTFSVAGINTILLQNRRLDTSVGTYSVAGTVLDINYQRVIIGTTGSFLVDGKTVLLQRNVRIDTTTGTFSVNGITIPLIKQSTLSTTAGTFTLNGVSVDLTVSGGGPAPLVCTTGTFVYTGTTTFLDRQYTLNANQGTYQLNASNVDVIANRNIQLSPSTFTMRLQSNGDFFWYRTTQTIQPVKYRITKRNEWILGRATHMGRRGL